jgi:hypothetical protein
MLAGGAAAGGALALGGCARTGAAIPGELGGADMTRGHALRDGRFPPPSGPEEAVALLIAGGGVAGLAAGWTLAEAGFADFALLELESATGGNARAGRNGVSAYPLGAHYLPVPNREAAALRHMLARLGMVVGEEEEGRPVYDPYQLCADLEERLLWRGGWQEGLVPRAGLSEADRAQWAAFDARMADYGAAVGADGRPAFASPMVHSSGDSRFTDLDRRSFAGWLDAQGWRSAPLRRHVRYCCRDDYGAEPEHVSAWAGVHYFACRRGWAARGDGDRELTWPDGNGRLAALMAARFAPQIRPDRTVFRVARDGESVLVDSFDHRHGRSVRTRARAVILAMPDFVAARVLGEKPASTMTYAPWIVANATVARHPRGKGAPLAWDNVSAASDSLGYVVATHQSQSAGDGPTVLSWYMPLSAMAPGEARKLMRDRALADWQGIVRDDLLAMNPDLDGAIERIDIWRWGHAMISPTPGFLSDPARRAAREAAPPILRAHSDMSGLSLFEEAHHWGTLAAERAMRYLGHAFESRI